MREEWDENASVSRKYHEEKLDDALEFGWQIAMLAGVVGLLVGIFIGYML